MTAEITEEEIMEWPLDEIVDYAVQANKDIRIFQTLLAELGHTDIVIDYDYFNETGKVLKENT